MYVFSCVHVCVCVYVCLVVCVCATPSRDHSKSVAIHIGIDKCRQCWFECVCECVVICAGVRTCVWSCVGVHLRVCMRDGLTHYVELGHAVIEAAAVPDHAAVAPRVVRPHVVDDQRAVGHHLEPGGERGEEGVRVDRSRAQGSASAGPVQTTGSRHAIE